jgi:hypothetical protein
MQSDIAARRDTLHSVWPSLQSPLSAMLSGMHSHEPLMSFLKLFTGESAFNCITFLLQNVSELHNIIFIRDSMHIKLDIFV